MPLFLFIYFYFKKNCKIHNKNNFSYIKLYIINKAKYYIIQMNIIKIIINMLL